MKGRVMEMLSEHTVEGWLEGYLLSGRHGFINSYEPFVHVIDSMFNQHAKWLEKCDELPWRAKMASLNLLITALVWRQDHNGFTHQDPGFLDVVTNKSPGVVRIYRDRISMPVASLSIAEMTEQGPLLKALGDRSHLGGKPAPAARHMSDEKALFTGNVGGIGTGTGVFQVTAWVVSSAP